MTKNLELLAMRKHPSSIHFPVSSRPLREDGYDCPSKQEYSLPLYQFFFQLYPSDTPLHQSLRCIVYVVGFFACVVWKILKIGYK